MEIPSKIINDFQHLLLLLRSEDKAISPHDIYIHRPNSFESGKQQDSYEYLQHLLLQLHDEEYSYIKTNKTNNKVLIGDLDGKPDTEHMDLLIAEQILMDIIAQAIALDSQSLTHHDDLGNALHPTTFTTCISEEPRESMIESPSDIKTLVQKLFGGELSINYTCSECKTESTRIEHFFDMQLSFSSSMLQNQSTVSNMDPMTDETMVSTQYLLDSLFATEILSNNNKYFCGECNEFSDGLREIELEKGPSHLILVFKHFEFNTRSRKLLYKVHYDSKISLVNGEGESLNYELESTVVHRGKGTDCGHYYTVGKNNSTEWFKFDDQHCRRFVGDINHLDAYETPYILFYKLKQTESNENSSDHDDECIDDYTSARHDETEGRKPLRFPINLINLS